MSKTIETRCAFGEAVKVTDLKHHPQNPNQHSEGQLRFIQKVLAHQGWRSPLIVSNLTGFVVCGNGRLMAAREMGLETVPVDYQDFETEADELAHILADNRIATLSEMNFEMAAGLLDELNGAGFDLDLTGFQDFEREPLLNADWKPPEVGDLNDPSSDTSASPIGLTKAQREKAYQLRVERRRRTAAGETNLVIRNGAVVARESRHFRESGEAEGPT